MNGLNDDDDEYLGLVTLYGAQLKPLKTFIFFTSEFAKYALKL